MENRKLFLAFDDSCGRCKRLSGRIQEATAGTLETIPLNSLVAQEMRAKTLDQRHPGNPL